MSAGRVEVTLDLGSSAPPQKVGSCVWMPDKKAAAFEWAPEAIAAKLNLSPIMMPARPGLWKGDGRLFNGLPGLLNDSLPDGFGLRVMDQALSRLGIPRQEANALHRLSWVGSHGAGALRFAPEIGAEGAAELMDIGRVARQADSAQSGDFSELAKSALAAGGSAQGARPKFWALLSENGKKALLGTHDKVPVGYTPSLIKFPPSKTDSDEPYFEAACLGLVAERGILAAKARLIPAGSKAALAVERFDRTAGGERIFVQTLSALIHHDFRLASLDYADLVKAARAIGCPEGDAERIYRQACMGVALSLRDDHSKNFAFLRSPSGQWTLSPAYDLCPCPGPGGWHTMSISGEAQSPGRDHLLRFAKEIGLSDAVASQGIEAALDAADAFKAAALGLGASKAGTDRLVKMMKANAAGLRPVKVAAGAKKGAKSPGA